MEDFKKTIPFQTNDSEFDNFFGLKLGMPLRDALFKVACYGLDIVAAYPKGKKITLTLERGGVTFFSCQLKEMYLTFVYRKGKYYLISSEIVILRDNHDGIEKLLANWHALESKYPLRKKMPYYIHKTSKNSIRLITLDDRISVKCSIKKRIEHIYENKTQFIYSFLAKESGEIWCFGWKLDRILKECYLISIKDTIAIYYLVIGLMQSDTYYKNKSRNYPDFWGHFSEFWERKGYKKKFIELAYKIKHIFEESDPNKPKETVASIFKLIEDTQNSIDAAEKEERKVKREAKKAKKEEAINKLSESLDDL